MTPRAYLSLDRSERAFICAAIQIKIENDKKRENAIKAKQRNPKRR
jgi:hypothetical protein